MGDILPKLRLDSNPFEPAATGAPLSGKLSPPDQLAHKTRHLLDLHQTGKGVKAIVIVGEYGTGKTCLLQWLHNEVFPSRQIKSFYFHDRAYNSTILQIGCYVLSDARILLS